MKRYLQILFVLLFITPAAEAQICDPGVPSFTVDLSTNPDSVWISPNTVRNEHCCGATNPDRCVQFVLTLHPSATGIAFNVYSGAMPPGALFYQIGCGPPTPVGEPICLNGPGPHIITFCKPGNNQNQYSITSFGPPGEPDDIVINDGCTGVLSVTGYQQSTLTWNSIYPGTPGTYNSYLSCAAACSTTYVNAQAGYPPYIDYQVCGIPVGACQSTPVCRTVRVTFNPTLAAQIVPINPTVCFGQTGTTITAIGSGGTPPYNYQWSTGATTASIFVGPGTYSVVIGDASGCPPTSTSVTVTSFSMPITANAGNDITVCAQSPAAQLNGTITAASGGIWSGGSGTINPSNTSLNALYTPSAAEVAAGFANLILTTTGNGTCPADADTVRINIVNFQGTVSTASNNVTCYGLANGSATATVNGTVTPYNYTWSTTPAQSGPTATGLSPGTYTVGITDGNGCSSAATVMITQPTPLVVTTTQTNISCDGGNDGTATGYASGGTAPYSYSWSNGSTNPTASGLQAGNHTLTVTDARGCTRQVQVSLTSPPVLTASVSSTTNVSCYGGANGSATVTTSGGTAPYTYNWSNGAVGSSASGLSAGTYTVTVIDNRGCNIQVPVTITQPSAPVAATFTLVNVSCTGGSDGTATITVTGGTPGYTYSWSNGSTGATASGFAAGNHQVLVTDNLGCQLLQGFTISQPTPLIVNLTGNNTTCELPNGSSTASVSGGTPPYQYSWSTGGTYSSVTGINAGTYSVTVTDANGCSKSGSIVISNVSPAIIPSISSQTNVSCFGGMNGSATVTATGGATPYTYSWTPVGGNSPTATGLGAGTYSVQITDANTCSASMQVVITQPSSLPSATVTLVSNVSCYGGNDGSLSASVTGGTSPYTYSWTPSGGISPTASGLTSGSYTLSVTDNNGCVTSASGYVSQPSPLNANTIITNVSCNGGTNGSIFASASGGTAPYTYSWSPVSQAGPSASNLTAGTYTLTLTDNKGCQLIKQAIVTQPQALAVLVTHNQPACNGGANGNATASVSGGTAPYTYSWSPNSSASNTANGLSAGTYNVYITDSKGCTTMGTVTIGQPPALAATVTAVNVSCRGANNGTASVAASGGTPGYTYTWSTGSTSASVSNLSPGSYYVIIRDSKGCARTETFTITQPAAFLSATSTQTNVSCFGGSNGTATVTAAGGTPGYTYSWNTLGLLGPTATNLSAGTYSVTVTDSKGCTFIKPVIIAQPQAITVTVSTSAVSCFGGSNGAASVQVTGGTPGFTYTWSTGSNATSVNGLSAGSYSITVNDSKGCSATQNFTITQPSAALNASLASSNVTCAGGSNGSIITLVSGGTPGYSYSWSPGGSTTSNPSGLAAGTYTVYVKDSKNCTTSSTITVTEPVAMTVNLSKTNATCGSANAQASVTVSGGLAPYTYSWSTGATTSSVTGLAAGAYSVTITDDGGCEQTQVVNISNISGPNAVILSIVHVSCFGGSDGQATVSHTGGTGPYTYSWNSVPSQNTATATNLPAGMYTVTVTDANGCQGVVTTDPEITQPPKLEASATGSPVSCFAGSNGTATVIAAGGTAPYTYSWSSGSTSPAASGLTAGTHTATVTDSKGCIATDTVQISQPSALSATVSTTPVSCFNGTNGSAVVTATGGVAPYTYSWSNGNLTSSHSSLTAGNYTVTTTDSKGCSVASSFTIMQPAAAISATFSTVNVSCFGGTNGQVTANVAGGTPAYTYSWSNGAGNTSVVNGLSAGSYSVTITDSKSCSQSYQVAVTQPQQLSAAITEINNVSCFGGSNGSAEVTANGGVAPYAYSWSFAGDTDTLLNNAPAGTYTVTITDNNGCQTATTVTLTQPSSALAVSASTVNVTCNGQSNGSAVAAASGGTSPYTYSWSPISQTGPAVSNLSAGTYSVHVSDAKSCSAVQQVIISQPSSPLAIAVTTTNPSCNGGSNGSISAVASGGTSPYSYSWNTGSTSQTLNNIGQGTYQVTVTDNLGCQTTSSATLFNPVVLNVSVTTTDVTCYGYNDGTASSLATGGTGAYTYSWSQGSGTGASITDLAPGSHQLVVTDQNGCQVSKAFNINQPAPLYVTYTTTNPGCNSSSNGSVNVIVSGGTPSYNYTWSPSTLTGPNPSGLTQGSYTVTVSDSKGCSVVKPVILQAPAPLTTSVSSGNVKCHAGNDGWALGTASGGTQPYTYSWSSGQTGQSIGNLVAGTYTFTVTDANGCAASSSVVISQPSNALTVSLTSSNVSCNGATDGSATATVSGGTLPYSYSWYPAGGNTSSLSGIGAGNYVVFVSDANQCNTSSAVQITQPPALSVSVSSKSDSYCGQNNGFINVTGTGGTPPYVISWSTGSTGSQASSLGPGTYTAIITDQNGCSSSVSATISEISSGTAAISSFSNVSCNGGANGTATVTVNGGTGPFTYVWSPFGGNAATATDLTAGNYTVTVLDSKGCSASASVTITQPTALVGAIGSKSDALCFAGNSGYASATVAGGTAPYSYSWNTSPAQFGQTAVNLTAGNYTVVITDNNGCNVSASVNISQPSQMNGIVSSLNASCYGTASGRATANVAGGTSPYTYSWSTVPVQNTPSAVGLTAGTYSVNIADGNGCSLTLTSTITQPSQVVTAGSPDATICRGTSTTLMAAASGGSGNYYYLWDHGLGAGNPQVVSPQITTTYVVTAYDQDGCAGTSDTVKVNVTSLQPDNLLVQAFTPICPGSSTTVYASVINSSGGTLTYSWNNGLPSGPGAYTVFPTEPTTYIVTVSNNCGVTVTDSVRVDFRPLPQVSFTISRYEGCEPLSVLFTDNTISSTDPVTGWIWDFGDGNSSTSPAPSHVYPNSGTYTPTLTVVTSGGCRQTFSNSSGQVTVYEGPEANFSLRSDVVNLPGEPVVTTNLSSPDATTFLWNFGDGSTSTQKDPTHNYSDVGIFNITLVSTNQNGCSDTITKEVRSTADLVFPNAFTPDPSGPNGGQYDMYELNNNVFHPFTAGVAEFKMMIFNRWGELIFETNDYRVGWDGYYRGVLCEQAVYVWKATVTMFDGRTFTKVGDVTLLR